MCPRRQVGLGEGCIGREHEAVWRLTTPMLGPDYAYARGDDLVAFLLGTTPSGPASENPLARMVASRNARRSAFPTIERFVGPVRMYA